MSRGSGKTAVLVERAVTLITREEAPLPAERLLILTFTNAAAEELRSRIGVRLEDELRRRPAASALRRQRIALRRAFIGTIDAFCQQLVKEHFTVLDLPPDVAVGDEALLAQLSAEALAEVMEEMYAEAAFAEFAALYGRARSDAAAERAVLDLYAYTRALPGPDERLEAFAAMYQSEAPLMETAWGRELAARAAEALAEAEARADAGLAVARANAGFESRAAAMEDIAAAVAAMRAALAGGNWDEAARLVQSYKFPPFKPLRGSEATKAAVGAHRDAVKGILSELEKYCFSCSEAEFEADRRAAGPMAAALCRAARRYAERYFAAKKEARALDFSDFEHLALSLLQGPGGERGPLAEKLCGRYDAVMVDEYQDTNDLQSALYECLARPEGDNLFYVGDVKQSIYRFRQANPGIFLARRDAWAAGEGHPAVVRLGHNYRSAPAVVNGVNFLFARLMSRALGEVEYGADEALICGAQHGAEGAFEVALVEGGSEDEADFVAGRIAEMVAAGETVQDGGEARACRYGDFCVLLRSRARLPVFLAAMRRRGVPAMADLAEQLLESPEVLPLVAALAAIDNPGDDVALAAAMLGPLFRFSAGEMASLRAEAPKGRLWAAVAASRSEKVRAFAGELSFYRAMAGDIGVGRLCEELAGRTGYLSAVAAMEAGGARRENLRRFMAWAAEMSAAGRGGLAGFVRLLAAGKGPQPPAVKTVPGQVSILTVHKSKGLEFPFCFVADAARSFNLRDLGARVQMHAELGLGLALRAGNALYPTLPALAIRARAAAEAMSEEMRVLYVALTRARQRVCVSFASARPAEYLAACLARPLSPYALGRARSFADWVMAAALRHPDAAGLLQGALGFDAGAETAAEAAGRLTLRMVTPAERAEENTEAYRLSARPDAELVRRLAAAFAARPARRPLAAVPAKLSVSALAKPGGQSLRRRPSFMYAAGLSAAERGTAQHVFMQHADFAAAALSAEAELRRLVDGGYMDAELAKAVDRAGVAAFLASPLAGRVAAARRMLREYDFITSVPAGEVDPALPAELAAESVLVQGIADLVLVGDGSVEIVDYKTDRDTSPEALAARYATQLELYRRALARRLGLPVRRLTIWSFELNREIDVPGMSETRSLL